ncbi:hypothetical protein RhiXN_08984 [Rhizoctonia solani]|uniref:Retrotransposon gag domain-containing protein n=1 Tax=Rhizoctonia solani TaxID=456999 RepID=A0A8H8SW64_9AGAM|nr:uncharacterized protein RhiXN_08984 [Rhizoctonia solani]QRW20009.1 hypothetical protein RhiXN_08984 [Rhizoctonia solani]
MPTAPPPPPLGRSSCSTNSTIPSGKSELKFAKPNKFSGKKEDALNFIIACQAYIRTQGANQSNEEKVMNVFRGETIPLLENIDTFWAEFTKHYVDTNCNKNYHQKWKSLQQKSSVQERIFELQQYSVSLGYSDGTLCNKYYDGLKREIKDIMLSTMFQWHHTTAQQVYDKAEEIENHIESSCLSNPSAPATTLQIPTTPTPTSNPTCTCLIVGDNIYMIDPTTCCARKGTITSIVCTTTSNMPNVRWNGEFKDTLSPFPSLKKDKCPTVATTSKPILASVPIPLSNSKGQGPMGLDGKGLASITCHGVTLWERPREENQFEVVSDEEELGKGKAKAN